MISLLVVSTSVWPRTARVVWSMTASRCTGAAPRRPLPRRALPSTATARRHARVGGGGRVEWLLVGQPPADHPVQRVRVNAGQHAADGGLGRWPPDPAQRVAARPKRGQHRAECVPSATAVAWVGDLGEAVEQATAKSGASTTGVSSRLAATGIGMMRGQARRSEGIMGFDTRMIAGSWPALHPARPTQSKHHQPSKPAPCRGPAS